MNSGNPVVTTAPGVDGHHVARNLGLVRGIVVRSPGLARGVIGTAVELVRS